MFLLTIYPPWLLNTLPYSYWASTCIAVLPTYSAFMISVRQASDLPPASFRFPVTQDTLALGYILPAVGRIRDFHPLKHAPAGRTMKKDRFAIYQASLSFFSILIVKFCIFRYGMNEPYVTTDDGSVTNVCIAAKNRRIGIDDDIITDIRMTFT